MKVAHTSNLLLLCLLIFLTAPAWATKVKMVTFSSSMARSGSTNHQTHLILGEPLVGRTNPAPGQSGAYLGFWEMWAQAGSVSPVEEEIPVARNELLRNTPNPFNPSTRISFTLGKETEVKVDLYDLRGRKLETLYDAVAPKGVTAFTYQPRNLASGAYLVLMRAGSFRATQRIMLLK